MTREEALNKAINIIRYFETNFAKSKEAREDAVNIIKALEQETCEDCISRVEAMETVFTYADGDLIADDIKCLTSVTPTHGTCKNCKYYRNRDKYSYCTKRLNVDSVTDRYREPNFYCADFEKRGSE